MPVILVCMVLNVLGMLKRIQFLRMLISRYRMQMNFVASYFHTDIICFIRKLRGGSCTIVIPKNGPLRGVMLIIFSWVIFFSSFSKILLGLTLYYILLIAILTINLPSLLKAHSIPWGIAKALRREGMKHLVRLFHPDILDDIFEIRFLYNSKKNPNIKISPHWVQNQFLW